MVTVFSDSNSSNVTPSPLSSHLQSDSPRPTFQLGFPPPIADFHLRQFRPLLPLFKCTAPVDPWRDSLHFEFPSPKNIEVHG